MDTENYLGYLKYSGKLVDEGYLDARKSAQALIGFDEAIRFFVKKTCPQLRDIDFELPIRIKKGSWEALIPQTIEQWIVTGVGTFLTTYGVTAAKKMAEKFQRQWSAKYFQIFLNCNTLVYKNWETYW